MSRKDDICSPPLLEEEKQQGQKEVRKRLVDAMVSEEVVKRSPKFTEDFYELLYQKRGNGWEKRDHNKGFV